MSRPTRTLTEAVTLLAFSETLCASELRDALGKGRFGGDTVAYTAIETAVELLCDAGFKQKIICFGRKVGDPQFNGNYVQLSEADFLTYRQLHYLEDALLRGDQTRLNVDSDFDLAFEAGCANDVSDLDCGPPRDYYRDVKVERDGLETLANTRPHPERFTSAERRAWIRNQPQMSADEGHRRFKQQARFDGTKQAQFRDEWKEIRETRRGAPLKKKRR